MGTICSVSGVFSSVLTQLEVLIGLSGIEEDLVHGGIAILVLGDALVLAHVLECDILYEQIA